MVVERSPSTSPAVAQEEATWAGRQIFMQSLVQHGVRYIFGNPGTTEMPLLDSLAEHPTLSYVLALHESVAVGAGHYYAQATGATSVVNLHVGPGLGNALGMLYNVWEARTPMLVTAGQQDTRMRLREPLLGHDLVAMARPLTKWSVEAQSADELAAILHRAFKVANDPPRGPVFVSLPIDVLEQTTGNPPEPPSELYRASRPEPSGVAAAAAALLAARRPAILIGDDVARAGAQDQLIALSELLGAPVYYEGLHHHISFPTRHPNCRDRISDHYAGIRAALVGVDAVLLVGGSFFEEVWFEAGPPFADGTAVLQIEAAAESLGKNFRLDVGLIADPGAGLAAVTDAVRGGADASFAAAARERNEALRAERQAEMARQRKRAEAKWEARPIAPARLMAELDAVLPPGAVVVNESITAGADLRRTLTFEGGDYYGTRGGGIGQALPGALGAKLAHPDRTVVALSGDGSAMYSIQALWTAVHHGLPILFVILHNRTYRILKFNMDIYRQRFARGGDRPYPHMDLTQPELDFVHLARGMGMEARQVTEPGELRPALEQALASNAPYLLDVVLDGTVPGER